MRNKYILMAAVLLLTFFTACGNSVDLPTNDETDAPTNGETTEIYEQLFDINNKIEINIDISDEQLALLQEDYNKYAAMGSKSPIYRDTPMSITITTADGSNTYEFENVGIRMKGNTSRTDFYNAGRGKYNLIHFKIKFPEQFAGLEKLDIRWNKLDDATYIREYYSYEFMRACGILAPHSNLASVNVSGVHEGVFTICEPIDELFIEKNLPEEEWDGDLYKCAWDEVGAMYTLDTTVGMENEETGEFFNYDLKNNKKTSNHELMNNLLAKLNDGEVTKEKLAELVDMDYFVKFAATSYFVGNPDDIRYNHNNHYIYFLKSSNKAIFIPCDNDRCFGVTKEWNPTGDGMTSVNPFSTLADGAQCEQASPLFKYTVDAGGYYIDEYAAALKEIAKNEWLTSKKFNSVYEIAYNNYKNDTNPDKSFDNAGMNKFKFDNTSSGGLGSTFGNASFAEYIDAKMSCYNDFISDISKYYEYVDMSNGGESNNDQWLPEDTGRGYSIRGTFNGWNMNDKYVMAYDPETNTYSYTLTLHSAEWMKIASNDDREWYGYDSITGTADEAYISYDKEHYDIILEAGTYLITFDGNNNSIEIVKQ
ncbi:MAG: hypothetical protein E7266_07905 [Lachnospiraceae bacterium]|nr:hypothetical protein [Lachnospiraceae bacterium]